MAQVISSFHVFIQFFPSGFYSLEIPYLRRLSSITFLASRALLWRVEKLLPPKMKKNILMVAIDWQFRILLSL
jgi:hypothetical protein